MRLLVSVRDAAEAAAALSGGADIIDAKEPMQGPLAPVLPYTLQEIDSAIPRMIPLSVALGDGTTERLADIVSAVAPLRLRDALYFKVALVSTSPRGAAASIASAVGILRHRPDRPSFVVARYVDALGDAADLVEWIEVCAASGAQGLLLDTSRKGSGGLLTFVTPRSLASLRRRAARQGIWLALGGGMTIDDVNVLADIRPHVLGVRGAVCNGCRTGTLSSVRVRQLREALDRVSLRTETQGSPG